MILMASSIFIPGTDVFVFAANDNGEHHRPPPSHIVMEARQQLAQMSERFAQSGAAAFYEQRLARRLAQNGAAAFNDKFAD